MTIHYLLAEDERLAYDELTRMIAQLRPGYRLDCWADSVEQAALYLQTHTPDLMFLDIQLSDMLCFELFERVSVDVPVIFTTAYDEYALQAFKQNSVDYLLKPIREEHLEAALAKFERHAGLRCGGERLARLSDTMWQAYKKPRFLVSKGDTYRYVETGNIALFYAEDKYVFLHTFDGQRYIVDYTLEQVESMLDRQWFFRVSRDCICHLKAIAQIRRSFNGRLRVELHPGFERDVSVSRSRSKEFLTWMDGGRP